MSFSAYTKQLARDGPRSQPPAQGPCRGSPRGIVGFPTPSELSSVISQTDSSAKGPRALLPGSPCWPALPGVTCVSQLWGFLTSCGHVHTLLARAAGEREGLCVQAPGCANPGFSPMASAGFSVGSEFLFPSQVGSTRTSRTYKFNRLWGECGLALSRRLQGYLERPRFFFVLFIFSLPIKGRQKKKEKQKRGFSSVTIELLPWCGDIGGRWP